MLALRDVWLMVTDVANTLFGSPFLTQGSQYPIGAKIGLSRPGHDAVKPGLPIFRPPGSNIDDFKCNYTNMDGFTQCGTSDDQSCWLRNDQTGQEYNITTDYENMTPTGITRVYYLNVTDGSINANGLDFKEAKLFNGTFPGPLIEACWGDTVEIHVRNHLPNNGTSIHWHGIRQWNTMHMDGVNGLTQCPIANQSEFIYRWHATQYGTSWYHSHYSVQYADGLQAPITIHGPSSYPYDIAIEPITITDWDTLDFLLGGLGNITRFTDGNVTNTDPIPSGFELLFDETQANPTTGAKRYLLRLINTAFENSFVFSIDNHILRVVEADFVPVKNFTTTSILIAIGQRYNVIVEAAPVVNISNPSGNPLPKDGNYWIRTYATDDSDLYNPKLNYSLDRNNYMKTGILRYDETSTADPTTSPWNVSTIPSDLSINEQLEPTFNWTVQAPANGKVGEVFNVAVLNQTLNETGPYATSFFAFQRPDETEKTYFQTTYGNPTFLNLANVGDEWPAGWVVVPENYSAADWVYLVINQPTFGPHPIHLHGHDFAIVEQKDNVTFDPAAFKPNLYINPPRRDVVLVSKTGYAVIAFKADNPGVWLMHCHIAAHASSGLSLQILERQSAANEIWPPGNSSALDAAHTLCASWNTWAYDCKHQWPGNTAGKDEKPVYPACDNATELQNDSGV